jgi:D-alanyl-D-alanine carboxypeptidase/D-alanyl-D-alanine-endopeptidase (penicillin-binding protein 4)
LSVRQGIALAALLLVVAAGATAATSYPPPVEAALRASGLPADSVGVLVQDVTASQPLIAANAERGMLTASVIKVLTTYAGLEMLGPAHAWSTEVHANGSIREGVLDGDLIIRGLGDPKITLESFWLLLRAVRGRGVREIRGDLVLDRSYFLVDEVDPGRFDNEPTQPYNTLPDALLVNHKAVRLTLTPDLESRRVRISAEPPLAEIQIVNNVLLDNAPCGDWRARLRQEVRNEGMAARFSFSGHLSAQCGEQARYYSVLAPQVYTAGLFRALWAELGGSLAGGIREGTVPRGAMLIARQESPALAELVRDINKFSNNVMARQLYLALGAAAFGAPATAEKSERAVRQWLAHKGLDVPGLALENGSGLSRIERISTRGMGNLLVAAWRSPVMPELIASMPLVGVDGTFRRRIRHGNVNGQAHIKGGSINGVRGIAGYVLDASGRRWAVACLINHPKVTNANAQPIFDSLLTWVHAQPGKSVARPFEPLLRPGTSAAARTESEPEEPQR